MRINNHDIKQMQIVEERSDAGERELRVFIQTGRHGLCTGLLAYDEDGYRVEYEQVDQFIREK